MTGCVPGLSRNKKSKQLRVIREDDFENTSLQNASSSRLSVYKTANDYNMDHPNRGKCVVFNHEHFQHMNQRRGTQYDVQRIQKTFGRLGFTVEVCDDYDYKAILKKIDSISEENHSENDCLCIIVLTHGVDDELVHSRNTSYKIKDLWKPFSADRCRTLAEKPKLFFFSACRGLKRDTGVVVVNQTETDGVHSYKIPTEADFLFGFSTVPGYVSHRLPSNGTWYIQSLCDVLDKYSATDHLVEILTKTTNEVSKRTSYNDFEEKQLPVFSSQLRCRVYLKPKQGESKFGPIFTRIVALLIHGVQRGILRLLPFQN